MHRFYVPTIGSENHVWLEGGEARHLSRVLRICAGDEVGVFDGTGIECVGVVERVERSRAKIEILRRERVDRDPRLAVTLGCAVVKSKAMALVVEKCCELGLRELVPVETRRSVPKVAAKEAAHLERWRRCAIEAVKQCGRTTLTRVAAPRPLPAFAAQADDFDLALLCSTDAEAPRLRRVLDSHPDAQSVLYLVGPEGGFERRERDLLRARGFVPVSLGKSTLRTETAATAALAAILYHYEG
ncbi:MAG: RsmE family RNA methyltransferase [Planctomycetota bacterium]